MKATSKHGGKATHHGSHDGAQAPANGPGTMGEDVVGLVLDFQSTGKGFEKVWNHVGPTVETMVRGRLLKRQVRGPSGGVDEDAVQEATQQVSVHLWELPGKGPQVWFDPARGVGGVDGLRTWLYGFCRKNVAEYCKKWRNAGSGKRKKVISLSSLQLNDQVSEEGGGQRDTLSDMKSIVKSAVTKIDPSTEVADREIRQIMNELTHEAVESLDEGFRTLIRLGHWDGLSERQIANRLTINVSSVHRRLKKAEKLARQYLLDRGFDSGWLGGAA